jgi:hypothetical protein
MKAGENIANCFVAQMRPRIRLSDQRTGARFLGVIAVKATPLKDEQPLRS